MAKRREDEQGPACRRRQLATLDKLKEALVKAEVEYREAEKAVTAAVKTLEGAEKARVASLRQLMAFRRS